MLILVAVTLTITLGDNGIINKAREAAFKQDVAQYNEELQSFIATHYEDSETKYIDENGKEMFLSEAIKKSEYSKVNNKDGDWKECIPSYDFDKYEKKFYVLNNELVYSYTGDKNEKAWAESLGIESKYKEVGISFKVQGEGEIQGITEMDFTAFVGQELNVTAVAKTLNLDSTNIAFEFTEWKKNGEIISTNAKQTITITEEAEYTAVFESEATLIYYKENEEEKIFATVEEKINSSTYSGTITDKTTITKLVLGKNVTSIEKNAFNGCTNLITELIIREGMTIGEAAFNNTGIEKVIIENGITVPANSFSNCKNLEKVEIGNGVALKGSGRDSCTFQNCEKLKEVTMGENIDISGGNYYNYLFKGTNNLETVTVKSLSAVASHALYGTGSALKGEIKINEGVTTIGEKAFYGCTNITNINIPNSVTSIGTNAFYGITGTINIDAASGSITGSPWGGVNATINWLK